MIRNAKKYLATALCLSFGLSLTACDQPAEGMQKAVKLTPEVEAAELEQVAVLDPNYIDGTMRFSVDLLKGSMAESQDVNENVLVSPLSVQLALAIAANGADGETLEEMQKVLTGCETNPDGMDMDSLNTQLESQMAQFATETDVTISNAHSLWVNGRSQLKLNEDYLQHIAAYQAELFESPFGKNTMEDMNTWISQKTDGMISNFITEEPDQDIPLYILDAMTFNADWHLQFPDVGMEEREFTNAAGEKQNIEFMWNKESQYIETEDVVGALKPYANERYAFVALLPKHTTANDYVKELNATELAMVLDSVKEESFDFYMPSYQSEYAIDLKESLKSLGMNLAFQENADFSKLHQVSDMSIYIGKVQHKTYIDVNQYGTRAEAATAVEVPYTGYAPDIEVVLDRPFVYAIVDTETNLPLFIGVLNSVE